MNTKDLSEQVIDYLRAKFEADEKEMQKLNKKLLQEEIIEENVKGLLKNSNRKYRDARHSILNC